MQRNTLIRIAIVLCLAAIIGLGIWFIGSVRRNVNLSAYTSQAGIADIKLPTGFHPEVFAKDLNSPRFLAFDPGGLLFVAERGGDRILKLPDLDNNGQADGVEIYYSEIDRPHSLTYHDGDWYVGIPTGVLRLVDEDNDGTADYSETVIGDIPGSGQHTTRTVEFLPDGRIVLSVGSSCNACVEEDPRRAAILVFNDLGGVGEEVFASGLRNAVGLTLHPESGQLWATNNARDLMGDNRPPDSIHAIEPGTDYGWPQCHAGTIPDPELGDPNSCNGIPEPALIIPAHSAPLGLTFYTGNAFPERYHGGLFIAYHGSWNRTIPTGYKVVFAPFIDGQPSGEIFDFATGWLDPETNEVSGRPVGLAISPDGALYISDDKAGLIYKITYGAENP